MNKLIARWECGKFWVEVEEDNLSFILKSSAIMGVIGGPGKMSREEVIERVQKMVDDSGRKYRRVV